MNKKGWLAACAVLVLTGCGGSKETQTVCRNTVDGIVTEVVMQHTDNDQLQNVAFEMEIPVNQLALDDGNQALPDSSVLIDVLSEEMDIPASEIQLEISADTIKVSITAASQAEIQSLLEIEDAQQLTLPAARESLESEGFGCHAE